MPQSVTFDFLFHAALREKENHFQISWEKKKRKMSGGISGHLARLFVCWNERSFSLPRLA
jgi:hypothetical protein